MTTPQATSPPPLNTTLEVIAASAAEDLTPIWQLPKARIIPALFEVIPPILDRWGTASAAAAANWYDELRDYQNIPGRFTAIVSHPDLGGKALAGWGADALKAAGAPPSISPVEAPVQQLDPVQEAQYRVEGGLQKRLVNAANHTVTNSADQDPKARGWMRRTRPGACKFCVMVASRGGVFTKASSTFACHEHCYCEAVPAWGGKALPVGPYKPSDRPSTAADRARVRSWIAKNL